MHWKSNGTATFATADGVTWILVYTKARAESWAELNLRKQGFLALLPRVASRGGFAPLFPRYVFVGFRDGDRASAIRNTLGVQYVVCCGEAPACVSPDVIADVRGRMDGHGVVQLEKRSPVDSLFAARERDRVRALVKLAQAGFRVKSA